MKKRLLILITGINLTVIINAQILWVPGGNIGNNTTNFNVGIGTQTPYGKLGLGNQEDIVSTYGITLGSDQSSVEFVGSNWSTGYGHRIYAIDSGDGTGTDLRFAGRKASLSWTDMLTVKGNGYVGIGTTNPYSILHIAENTIYETDIVIQNSNTGTGISKSAAILFRGTDVVGTIKNAGKIVGAPDDYNYIGAHLQFWIRNGADETLYERMRIASNGNVGIGTTSPQSRMDVYGGLKVGATSDLTPVAGKEIVITPISGTTAGIFFQHNGINSVFIKSDGATQYTTFGANAGTFLSINNTNGNVGIGTTNPQNKLDVNGTIRAKEIKATLDNWSDYVFDKDYKLMSLSDVENYIKTNNRLPEIPSADEVAKEGVNLGEMQTKLLQKIEELTLYVIEQNKRIENQNQQHKELDKTLEEQKTEIRALKDALNKLHWQGTINFETSFCK